MVAVSRWFGQEFSQKNQECSFQELWCGVLEILMFLEIKQVLLTHYHIIQSLLTLLNGFWKNEGKEENASQQ